MRGLERSVRGGRSLLRLNRDDRVQLEATREWKARSLNAESGAESRAESRERLYEAFMSHSGFAATVIPS